MNTYWRLLGFAKPIEKYAIPYFFSVLFHAIFNTFNFVLIIPILNTLFESSVAKEVVTQMPEFALNTAYFQGLINYALYVIWGPGYQVMDVLILLAIIIVVSVFLSNLFKYFSQRTMENMRIDTLEKIRNKVYKYVMGMHVGFFSNERKGDIISKITSDVQVVRFCITNTLQVVFREPFLIFGYLFALIKISWELTIFTALFLPITAFIIGRIVKKLRSSAKRAQENFGEMSSALDESLAGVKIIKAYNATDYIVSKFKDINKRYSKISKYISRRQQLASPMSEFLGISAVSIILIFGGKLVLGGSLDAADFMAYIAIFSQITRPVRTLADSFTTINQGIAAGERVLGLLDTENEIKDKENAIELAEFNNEIEFKDVRMSYDKTREIIKGISFTIKKGETVALVGQSGGGKSTIADLIPRFYDVSSGAILVDGIDIKDYKKDSLRGIMGMVAQDSFMFNDTIENNIRFGNLTATMEDVENAAKIANAHKFIMENELGYQNSIGDRGMKLSGGQRQRISIARAVLKNPEILILDEATSALDTESEVLVQRALESLLKGRTSVVIAHRLSTIRNADKIIVIEEGQIVEQGNHQELMANKGVYAKLIEMQQLS
ncbi:MAG: ABC transporter ATP-binding protein [Rikenellaceae bacterium]